MIIWLASYPKSGNTWVRAMLSSLLYTDDGCFDIKNLYKIDNYPNRQYFKNFVNDFRNIHEIKKHWISTQDKMNLDNKVKFFKTHNALCKLDNYSFSNSENTLGTIYIVRDPRNVITSIVNHFSYSYEQAKNFMFNSAQSIGPDVNQSWGMGTILGSWSDHYNHWTKNNPKLLLIKYEDLILNTENELKKIANFINKYKKIDANEKKIKNCVKTASFKNLKKNEEEGLFKENTKNLTTGEKIKFFYMGKKNRWENLLDKKIQIEIEQKFYKEMKELNYL